MKVVDKMSMAEKEKLDKLWDEFINTLQSEGFDKELKQYLDSIKSLAELEISQIDDESFRREIDGHIDTIVKFIERYKEEYYEIGCIEGFKNYDRRKLSEQDYYYYLADQKVKALVYYLRYLNFIERSQLEDKRKKEIIESLQQLNHSLKQKIKSTQSNQERKKEILKALNEFEFGAEEETKADDLKKQCEAFIKEIEELPYDYQVEVSEETTEAKESLPIIEEIKQSCLQYLDEINSSMDPEYKKYMMFNNLMREIRFLGASYQYLWHWQQSKKTLYRSGVLDSRDNQNLAESKKDYVKKMFQDCIDHMNSPSKLRHSYSENALIAIYKYLVLKKEEKDINSRERLEGKTGVFLKYEHFYNDNTVAFNIIKQADLNSIFVNKEAKSFYEFAVGDQPEHYDLPFIVEIYPQSSAERGRNAKGMIIGMRDWLLPTYLKSLGVDASFSKMKVADDKEVITYGQCYSQKIELNAINSASIDFNADEYNGTLFSMTLNKEDIIYLLFKLCEKKKAPQSMETIIEEIADKFSKLDKLFEREEYYSDDFKNLCSNESDEKQYEPRKKALKWTETNAQGLSFEISLNCSYFKAIHNKVRKKTLEEIKKILEEIKKDLKETLQSAIRQKLQARYTRICGDEHPKIDFILSAIDKKDYCFELIKKEYTAYKDVPSEVDNEIIALKRLVFRG